MRSFLAFVFAFGFAGHVALANCGAIPMPPAKYDHAALREKIEFAQWGLVDRLCREHVFAETYQVVKACSWTKDYIGHVLLPDIGGDITTEWDACALRHEQAHLNGWPATHPDAHFE